MPRRYITVDEQRQVIERANRRCEYCKSAMDYAAQSFVMEHIIPIAAGGETALDNLALACGGCNGHKHIKLTGLDPVSQTQVSLFHPRRQTWDEHFAWDADFLQVVGLTPAGRATVEELSLNRLGIVNMRRLLLLAGLHPP
ncbi:HNH endonuclease signature motif containing protein [Leptolyngbya sp. CCNP1308]|uniref:HNH endonuclease n=1 Tax=Leptolyngbya sp. CCNP1308 TaxID=3110255 RepID=UPI002B1FC632|nr:HNH endonuclease signature motif containing protein [Leptolyngbya sp. CCNP1308]MEA5448844.1 HNH endonuclease signature motif containing protein [Leptolyngbya sp. CCNP1308]